MKAMLKSGSTEKSAAAGNGRSTQRRKIAGPDASQSLADAPRTIAQRKQLEGAFGSAIQRQNLEEEEPLQGKLKTAQRVGLEEEEPMQGKFEPVQRAAEATSDGPTPNRTGMPDSLKTGIESLSGLSMDNVKVHYESSQPAQLNAHAYA